MGLNPYRALNITSSYKSDDLSEKDVDDLQQGLVCSNAGASDTWDCKFLIPWDMMPLDSGDAYYFQVGCIRPQLTLEQSLKSGEKITHCQNEWDFLSDY